MSAHMKDRWLFMEILFSLLLRLLPIYSLSDLLIECSFWIYDSKTFTSGDFQRKKRIRMHTQKQNSHACPPRNSHASLYTLRIQKQPLQIF